MNFTVCCIIIITGVALMWEEFLAIFNQCPLATTAAFHQQSMKLVMFLAFGMSRVAQTEISMSTFIGRISFLDLNQILIKKQM